MTRLFNTHSLTFVRSGSATSKPKIDSRGRVVNPPEEKQIQTKGSLQPISVMDDRDPTPRGGYENEIFVYYTKDTLRTIEQFGNNKADTVCIDNKWYKVTRHGKWKGFNLRIDHNQYFLQLIQPRPAGK